MGIVLAPGTANASTGGGCGSDTVAGGSVKACISASGANLEPDGYVLSNSECSTVHIILTDQTTKTNVLDYNVGCGLGHIGPFAYKGVNGHKYVTLVDLITYDGSTLAVAVSPTEAFSD
jgi:hypothetical protein